MRWILKMLIIFYVRWVFGKYCLHEGISCKRYDQQMELVPTLPSNVLIMVYHVKCHWYVTGLLPLSLNKSDTHTVSKADCSWNVVSVVCVSDNAQSPLT
jgi:hypothetical protein